MAQIPLPDSLLARLHQTARQEGLTLPLLFEQMLDAYLRSRQQLKIRNAVDAANTEPFDPMEREIKAFQQLHTSLWAHYPNQYIAIYQGKLVDHDADKLALFERIEEAYPNEFVLMRPVQEQPAREFHFRSPRYIERI